MTEDTKKKIYSEWWDGALAPELAAKYGVDVSVIVSIIAENQLELL